MPADEALADGSAPADPRDAAFLAALVYGALRWHHRLVWQAERLLARPLKRRDAEVGALIRIGLLQLEHLRVPDHAAVAATVDAAAGLGRRDAAGLVNAVLRRFQRERAELDRDAAAVPEARYSHPSWLLDVLARDWPDDWQRIVEVGNRAGPMWLRVNLARTERAAYLERLAAAGIAARPSAEVPSAVELAEPSPVTALPGFETGEVSVQDVAAQRAAYYLDLAPGQRVLDACAAPGGKTGHILEACPGLAEVWAVDRDSARLALVSDNLKRLGLSAQLVAADAADPAAWWDGRPFDRVLLDAPCSAVGVIRRHPDIKVLRRPADVARAVALQTRLLERLWPLVAPGGRLVYATCTVLHDENDRRIAAFLATAPDAEPVGPNGAMARQFLPGETGGDGFYYACIRKSDVLRCSRVSPPQQQ